MGVVYRARDTQLERTVALKVLGEFLSADETARARLLREARTASALNHPNICTIHEVGEAEGQTYIAMEFVEGRPLSAAIAGQGLAVETVLRYGIQVADALAHAHEKGTVHRDLKSSNVVITPEGRVKVLDFGLAKRLRERPGEATRSRESLTEAGTVVGTLSYMAPEVLRGRQADERSDLWAVGVMLHEMVAGELPFRGQTGFEISSAILREAAPPLPERAPLGLRAIIQRCLAKEAGERYQRAGEVRAALEAIQLGAAVAPAALAPVSAGGWSRRQWIGAAGAAAVALVSIGFGISRRKRQQVPQAGPRLSNGGRPSKNPEANEYFERALLVERGQFDLQKMRQMLERALEIDARFAEARAEYGFTHLLMIMTGYSNDASWVYKAEAELRRALQDDPDCGRAHASLAGVYMHMGRKERMPAEVEKALKANSDDPEAWVWLLHYHWSNGDYAQAQAAAKQALDRHPLYFPARMLLGEMLREQGDIAGAIREQQRSLDQDPQNIHVRWFLARAYIDSGDLPKARQRLEAARPADRQAYTTRLLWGRLLALEGKPAEARKEVDEEVLKHAALLSWLNLDVAEFYALLGEAPKALEWLDRAVRAGDDREDWFRRDPMLANIRNEPRFQQILSSVAFRRKQRAKQ